MNDILPNSKPRERKIDWNISRSGIEWIYIFCANCGADGGRVLQNDVDHCFYLCQSCADKYGNIAGTMMVPDEVFFERAKQAQIEKYGRVLSEDELLVELQDGSSFMSGIKKENS